MLFDLWGSHSGALLHQIQRRRHNRRIPLAKATAREKTYWGGSGSGCYTLKIPRCLYCWSPSPNSSLRSLLRSCAQYSRRPDERYSFSLVGPVFSYTRFIYLGVGLPVLLFGLIGFWVTFIRAKPSTEVALSGRCWLGWRSPLSVHVYA